MSESSGGDNQKQAFEQLHSALGVKKQRLPFSLPPFKFPWGLVRIVAALVILGPILMAGRTT